MEDIRRKLTELFKDWSEYAMSSLLEIARRNGIKYVAIHTAESIAARDPSVEADKIKLYYDTLAEILRLRQADHRLGRAVSLIWVRQASAK